MIRVLNVVDGMSIGGGIQSFIMNVYRNMDREKVQFDFLLHRHNEYTYEPEIRSMGGRIFYSPGRKEGILKNKQGLDRFFKEHPEYRIVHFHASSLSYVEPLIAAYKHNVPIRIMHSHSTRIVGKAKYVHLLLHYFNKLNIWRYTTDYAACGEIAANWAFGGTEARKNVVILKNGIDLDHFSFRQEKRDSARLELNLVDKYVICHVGRFEKVKNHEFLLQIFKQVLQKCRNAVLLLVGNGSLMDLVQQEAKELELSEHIRFLSVRSDMDRIYHAADCVVLPSLYEGFPITGVEAQATGVPFVMSDTITKEVAMKPNVRIVSLNAKPEEWADNILNNTERYIDNTPLIERGMDIQTTEELLLRMYRV